MLFSREASISLEKTIVEGSTAIPAGLRSAEAQWGLVLPPGHPPNSPHALPVGPGLSMDAQPHLKLLGAQPACARQRAEGQRQF